MTRYLMAVLVAIALSACGTANLPTSQQLELNVPKAVRKCSAWPRSPGKTASNRLTAKYMLQAKAAYLSCGGNVTTLDRILTKYEQRRGKLK